MPRSIRYPRDLQDEIDRLRQPKLTSLDLIGLKDQLEKQKEAERRAAFNEVESMQGNPAQEHYDTVPLDQRTGFLGSYGQEIRDKAARGETFDNADFIPYEAADIHSPVTPKPSRTDQMWEFARRGLITPAQAANYERLSQPQPKEEPEKIRTARALMAADPKVYPTLVDAIKGVKELETTDKPARYQFIPTDNGYIGVNPNDPTDQMQLGIKKPMSSEQLDSLEKVKTLMDTVDTIGSLRKEDYTGAVQGRMGWMRAKTGVGLTEEESSFRSKTAELMKMVYALSGKQINTQEMERLRPFLPEVNDSDLDFRTKLKNLKEQLGMILDNKIKTFGGAGYGTGNIGGGQSQGQGTIKTAEDFLRKYGGK